MRLSAAEDYDAALPLLQAGFNGRETSGFSNPSDLLACAWELATLLLQGPEPLAALEAFGVVLELARQTG